MQSILFLKEKKTSVLIYINVFLYSFGDTYSMLEEKFIQSVFSQRLFLLTQGHIENPDMARAHCLLFRIDCFSLSHGLSLTLWRTAILTSM